MSNEYCPLCGSYELDWHKDLSTVHTTEDQFILNWSEGIRSLYFRLVKLEQKEHK
jgi:hypothetical protein